MSDLIMISASKDDFLKNRRDEILTSIEKVVEKSGENCIINCFHLTILFIFVVFNLVLLSPSDIKTEEEIAIADTQFEEHSEAPMIIPSDVQTDSETVEKSDKETDERNIPEVGKLDVYINKSLEEALDTGRQHIQKTWKEAAEGSKKCDRKYREKLLPSILKKAYIKQFDKSFPEKLKNPNPEIAVTVGGKPKIVTFKNNKPVYTFKRPTLPINSIPPVGSRELLHNGIDVEPNSNPTTSTTAMDTDVTPDLVGFLRKWTKDHKIPMPALNCLLKFLRLFPSMDFLPADAKKVLGSPEFNDSPQAKLLNLIETKFEKVFSRLTSVENNHKLMTNTMNVLMESVGSSSAQPSKRPKLQIEIGRAAPTTEEATSSEITLPLSSLVDMRKFNQLLCSKNFYEEMVF